jgi:predicted transcriptional regulator
MSSQKFRLRGFRRLSDAVVESLGDLERRALSSVRERGEASVSQVCELLPGGYAYTTIMTTLDRLYKKGLLDRRKEGRAFFYKARYSAEEMERGVAEDVIAGLLDTTTGRIEPVLACIVDSVSDRDRQLLDELERLVREKREALSREGDAS